MSLTLITDRTEDDVRRLAALLAKPYSTWTDAERTWFSGAGEPVRGDYRYTDRNRVGAAVATLQTQLLGGLQELAAYLAAREVAPDELFRLPYEAADVDVSPRTDWTESGIPTREEMEAYLQDIRTLRGLLTLPGTLAPLPESMRYLDHTGANAIEETLLAVESALAAALADRKANADRAALSQWHSAEINCGEE